MDFTGLTFGVVFTFLDDTYVFLADSADTNIVYAAKILDQEKSRLALMMRDKYENVIKSNPKNVTFTLVVLMTKDFQDQVASLNKSDYERSLIGFPPYKRLNEEDCKKIKEEILKGSFPPELKEKLSLTT